MMDIKITCIDPSLMSAVSSKVVYQVFEVKDQSSQTFWHNLLDGEPHSVCYVETDDKNKVNLCEKGSVLSAPQKSNVVLTKRQNFSHLKCNERLEQPAPFKQIIAENAIRNKGQQQRQERK